MAALPGQKPRLLSSFEYASRVIESGKCGTPPGCGGARRPEKRVTARSKLPQKKCTGLDFPTKCARNWFKTQADCATMRQQRVAYSGSYAACLSSWSKGVASSISLGLV